MNVYIQKSEREKKVVFWCSVVNNYVNNNKWYNDINNA